MFTQTITVEVTAPSVPGSTTTLRVHAVNNYDSGSTCTSYVTLTAGAFPPPPTGVPQFPYGMALLMAFAIPALLLVKSKRSALVNH